MWCEVGPPLWGGLSDRQAEPFVSQPCCFLTVDSEAAAEPLCVSVPLVSWRGDDPRPL